MVVVGMVRVREGLISPASCSEYIKEPPSDWPIFILLINYLVPSQHWPYLSLQTPSLGTSTDTSFFSGSPLETLLNSATASST